MLYMRQGCLFPVLLYIFQKGSLDIGLGHKLQVLRCMIQEGTPCTWPQNLRKCYMCLPGSLCTLQTLCLCCMFQLNKKSMLFVLLNYNFQICKMYTRCFLSSYTCQLSMQYNIQKMGVLCWWNMFLQCTKNTEETLYQLHMRLLGNLNTCPQSLMKMWLSTRCIRPNLGSCNFHRKPTLSALHL